jgi:hypothetical protein
MDSTNVPTQGEDQMPNIFLLGRLSEGSIQLQPPAGRIVGRDAARLWDGIILVRPSPLARSSMSRVADCPPSARMQAYQPISRKIERTWGESGLARGGQDGMGYVRKGSLPTERQGLRLAASDGDENFVGKGSM